MPDDLTERMKTLVQSVDNIQEFADLASDEGTWRRIDKAAVVLPRQVGVAELECPACFDEIRLLFDKFASDGTRTSLTCPHCSAGLVSVGHFTGYTTEVALEEED